MTDIKGELGLEVGNNSTRWTIMEKVRIEICEIGYKLHISTDEMKVWSISTNVSYFTGKTAWSKKKLVGAILYEIHPMIIEVHLLPRSEGPSAISPLN